MFENIRIQIKIHLVQVKKGASGFNCQECSDTFEYKVMGLENKYEDNVQEYKYFSHNYTVRPLEIKTSLLGQIHWALSGIIAFSS